MSIATTSKRIGWEVELRMARQEVLSDPHHLTVLAGVTDSSARPARGSPVRISQNTRCRRERHGSISPQRRATLRATMRKPRATRTQRPALRRRDRTLGDPGSMASNLVAAAAGAHGHE